MSRWIIHCQSQAFGLVPAWWESCPLDVNESFETAKEVLPPKDAPTTIFGNGESFVGNLKHVANNSGW